MDSDVAMIEVVEADMTDWLAVMEVEPALAVVVEASPSTLVAGGA
jgi:hypothetical protein